MNTALSAITGPLRLADGRRARSALPGWPQWHPRLSRPAQPAPRMTQDTPRSVSRLGAAHLWGDQEKSAWKDPGPDAEFHDPGRNSREAKALIQGWLTWGRSCQSRGMGSWNGSREC